MEKKVHQLLMIMSLIVLNITMNAQKPQSFSKEELGLIKDASATVPMRVLLTTSEQDEVILRTKSIEINPQDKAIKLLKERLLATVNDEATKGVGIAAPQVGINKRLFLVQRLDKEDKAFQLFINPQITWYSEILRKGREGCLSIPDRYGEVLRSLVIEVSYIDEKGRSQKELIEGFTAVIFQHEYDHLDGVLYIDRIEEEAAHVYQRAEEQQQLFYKKK